MNKKSILDALNLLRGTPQKEVEETLTDIELTAKTARQLRPDEEVKDLYEEGGDKAPSREELNVGSPQSASGAGAEKLIREHSDLAPQIGLQVQYEKIAAMLGDISGMLRSMARKAEDEKDDKDDDEDEDGVEKARDHTTALIEMAKSKLEKIEKLSKQLDATKSAKNKKVIKTKIDDLTDDVSEILAKARRGVLFVDSDDLMESFNEVALKADADLVDSKEDTDEEDKKEDKKSKKTESVDEDDAAAKALQTQVEMLEKTLNGQAVALGEMKDLFNAMSNKSRNLVVPTMTVTKSQPTEDESDKIFDRMQSVSLTPQDHTMCDNIIQMKQMVKSGMKSQADFDKMMKSAPDSVKEIFAV